MENFFALINWGYAGSVILLTYLILTFFFKNPNKFLKIGVHLLAGVVLGYVSYIQKVPVLDLILSFLISVVAYAWGVKIILEKFGSGSEKSVYDNKIGVV
jgi:hypothetical protein